MLFKKAISFLKFINYGQSDIKGGAWVGTMRVNFEFDLTFVI